MNRLSAPVGSSFVSVGTYHLAMAEGNDPAQFVGFTAEGVRLVKFALKTARSGREKEVVGLSEVRFAGAPSCR